MIRAISMTSKQHPDWQEHASSVWIDVLSPTPEELEALQARFHMNPMALEDALTEGHWSRFEQYPDHAFLVYRTLKPDPKPSEDSERVSLFWYPETDTLITLRLREVQYLNEVWNNFEPVTHGIEERVIYQLLSRGATQFMHFTDRLHEEIDRLEELMFRVNGHSRLIQQVFARKHQIMTGRRLVGSARESVAGFARHSALMGRESGSKETEELTLYLRDIVDVLGRASESLDSSREVLSSILDVNLTLQSNRMNEVMKTLTTVSTIFLPLTFLAGVWGMNFEFEPEFKWRYGYLFAWGSFLVVGIGLAVFFKRKRWW
ncbi:magnesium transporter CorA family protein [Deinococcus misasensis]|uniref:magnesium transporter CorA family protein n=1 Tax=Deinococcus misasensis TaxID=392413 RepID=UPI00054D3F59|nr:magnesium transporter CorA family protein [Deinococcus misasensis]